MMLVSSARLVTLTGAGGVGKTRLALEAATGLRDDFVDGVSFIELAPLADPALVPQSITTTLGLKEQEGAPLETVLKDYLRDKNLLLILDNCEHILEACARLIEELLQGAPRLKILATSREPLGIIGESTYRVPSLSLPNSSDASLDDISHSDAAKLFMDRAVAVKNDFAITQANALAVAQICQRLDGSPLAIELAATRVQIFSPEQIAARLNDRFRLLTGGSRTAVPRQQTLRAAMDWSYGLLSASERTLFQRLSVFASGWTYQAAESVCAGEGIESDAMVDLIGQLVSKSLVMAEEREGETRYRMLETIRQYAREKLLDSGEGEHVRDRHLDFFQKLAEHGEAMYFRGRLVEWIPRLEVEHDNLRAALEWACERDPETARWLAGLLRWFWLLDDHLSEARVWSVRVLGLGQRTKTKGWAIASLGAGVASIGLSDNDKACLFLEESIALFRELGEKTRLAESLSYLGRSMIVLGQDAKACAVYEENESLIRESATPFHLAASLSMWGRAIANSRHDYATAKALHEESIAIARASNDLRALGATHMNLGYWATQQGDYAAARHYHLESLAWRRKLGSRWQIAIALRDVADVMSLQEDYQAAQPLYEEALTLFRAIGDQFFAAWTIYRLGYLSLHQNDYDRSVELFTESLEMYREREDPRGFANCFAGLGELRRVQGRGEQAVRLLGFAEASLQSSGRALVPADRVEYERSIAAARSQLDEASFNKAWGEGRAMSLEQAVEYALKETT